MSISRAVDSWKELIESGTDPFAGSAVSSAQLQLETSLSALRAQWVQACLKFNETEAEQTLNHAFSAHAVENVCGEVLQQGLADLGMQWYENKANVQQEHFASALAMRRLEALLSACPLPTREQSVVVACPPGEWHTFSGLLIALLLRRRGWKVVNLGANVPAEKLGEATQTIGASLVILVAQQLVTAASLAEAAELLAQVNIPVAFGGKIFNTHKSLPARIRGHYLGTSVKSSIGEIELFLQKPIKIATSIEISNEYASSAALFQTNMLQIEATAHKSLSGFGQISDAMKTATEYLSQNILAALKLGDIALIDHEVAWVGILLKSNSISPEALEQFITIYTQAVNSHIQVKSNPIFNWLKIQTTEKN